MKNIYHFTLVVFALAGLVVSCNKADVEVIPEGLIAFRQTGLESAFSATIQTKAAAVTDLSSFNVTCTTGSAGSETSVWNNVAFTKNGSVFKAGDGGKWWPASNPGYHFYAANAALTFNAAGPTVAATNGTDVVCAYMPNPTYKGTNTLQFKHIFARITDVTFSSIDGYTISGISVTITPKTGGTYNLRTGNGQTNGTGWSSLTTGSATGIANATPGTKSNDLYLVPGTYTLTASWTATKGNYTKTFSNKTVDIAVVGGCRNAITASLTGDASEVLFSVSVAAWGSNTIAVGTFPTNPAGSINGKFSVSATKQVYFAKGNLQAVIGSGISDYRATASSWKFAERQYDIIGNAGGNTSFAVGTTVDLFGWVGASASYDSYGLCTNTSVNNTYYGTSASDALKTDWGSIPGVVSSYGAGWRTLTNAEWDYLFAQRTNASSLYGHCQITTASGTVIGMLILPDNWTKPSNCTVTPGTGAFDRVTYSATAASGASNAWCDMEVAGAVFLPVTGCRVDVNVFVGDNGYYWSSSVGGEYYAHNVYFVYGELYPMYGVDRHYGSSVRLVRDSS